MKYILWAQNESTAIPPTIIVDDNIITDPDKQEEAYAIISDKNDNLEMSPQYREEQLKESKKLYKKLVEKGCMFNSNTFTLSANYAINEGVYIQGCYIDKDERARLMPFMFFAYNVTSMKEAQDILKKASSKIGRTCNTFELAYLMFIYNRRKNPKKKILLTTILILLVMLIIILLVVNGK